MNKLIEIKKLTYYDLFNNFNITLPKDNLIYLAGPNNCGKTTLVRILNKRLKSKFIININEEELDQSNLIDYYKEIECLIPNEISINNTLEEKILKYNTKVKVDKLIKDLKLTKYKKTNINNLDIKNKIKLQLLLSLLKKPTLLVIDNIMSYFDKDEVEELNNILKEYIKTYKVTILITTINLNNTINSDYLIIMIDNNIILEGKPLEVLDKDNIINKVGLDLPFMIDLSSKLRDYNLIEKIEIDKERLIDTLWK